MYKREPPTIPNLQGSVPADQFVAPSQVPKTPTEEGSSETDAQDSMEVDAQGSVPASAEP